MLCDIDTRRACIIAHRIFEQCSFGFSYQKWNIEELTGGLLRKKTDALLRFKPNIKSLDVNFSNITAAAPCFKEDIWYIVERVPDVLIRIKNSDVLLPALPQTGHPNLKVEVSTGNVDAVASALRDGVVLTVINVTPAPSVESFKNFCEVLNESRVKEVTLDVGRNSYESVDTSMFGRLDKFKVINEDYSKNSKLLKLATTVQDNSLWTNNVATTLLMDCLCDNKRLQSLMLSHIDFTVLLITHNLMESFNQMLAATGCSLHFLGYSLIDPMIIAFIKSIAYPKSKMIHLSGELYLHKVCTLLIKYHLPEYNLTTQLVDHTRYSYEDLLLLLSSYPTVHAMWSLLGRPAVGALL